MLYSLEDKPDIHAYDDYAFRWACSSGRLEVAKWLYSLTDKPDIHAVKDFAFRSACRKGKLEIAKWLYSLKDKPDIHAGNDYVFNWASGIIFNKDRTYSDVDKWLCSLKTS